MSKIKNTEAPLTKNQEITVEITALSSEGQGIGRFEGFAVFVPYALAGETVRAHVIKVSKNYCVAKLIEVVKMSEDRVEPACDCYVRCGGCSLQHLSYQKQLEFKRERVLSALQRIGGVDSAVINDIIPSELQLRYRNKAGIPFGLGQGGRVCAGLYAPKSHRLIEISDCPIQTSGAMVATRVVTAWANEFNVKPYDELARAGSLRHVVTRTNNKGEMLVAIVTHERTLKHAKELVDALKTNIPSLVGVVHNINSRGDNLILSDEYEPLFGNMTLEEELCSYKFSVDMPSFLQVNRAQTEKLYELAVKALNLKGTETVLDIYCGIGTISLMLAARAKSVVGIEVVNAAIENARQNAVNNGITNAEFITGTAETVLPKLIAAKNMEVDAAVIDPPRKGCEPPVLRALIDSKVSRIAYVSCNPETLARDIAILQNEGNYTVISATPVDMFPQTAHVETVVVMSREK